MALKGHHHSGAHWTSDGELVQGSDEFVFAARAQARNADQGDHDHRDWTIILSLPPETAAAGHGDDWIPILSTGSDGQRGAIVVFSPAEQAQGQGHDPGEICVTDLALHDGGWW
ncbi:hypothetical protein [Celeribacter neptunius]|uniref:Uncharacterized protein n=1 Tax=Celeribacter neptunius TaxID=588602 RepID=A0A1I3V7Y3_9RHOB|nr:hypothetical protein [Celeribacter neptunius]SFJ91089.1 hypothetical protein SAMN04487991_3239 [Celeribacter neptunius]